METWDGDFKAFTGSLPQLNTAFYRTEDGLLVPSPKVVCIDEGTTGGIRIAGAGILLGAKETIEMLRELEIQTVHSHDGCGAAALAAKEAGKYLDEPDRYGQEFAAEVAEALGAKHHHIRRDQLRRPQTMHDATVVYYSGVKAFNPARHKDLPKGFTIIRAIHNHGPSKKTAADEVAVACQIAFGAHGFGDRFTPDNPLIIVPIGNPHRDELSVERLKEELEPVVEQYGDRVLVSGFTSPF
jgi:hypothetical protein